MIKSSIDIKIGRFKSSFKDVNYTITYTDEMFIVVEISIGPDTLF